MRRPAVIFTFTADPISFLVGRRQEGRQRVQNASLQLAPLFYWLVKGRQRDKEFDIIFTFTASSTPLLVGATHTNGHVLHFNALGTRRTVGGGTDRSL